MAQTAQMHSFLEPYTEAQKVYMLQRKAYMDDPFPHYASRIENLKKLEKLISDNTEAIAEAIYKDFGHRSPIETKLLEVFSSLSGIRYTLRHLKRWMKPQNREVSIIFMTGRNRVIPQPKGIVGIIVPWNYPVFLLFGPLISAFAAGNRCMIKMAANSRNLCRLLHELFSKTFPQDLVAILPEVTGTEFSALPFDHLVFTGSADSGRTVMHSAADNLCPVTLELGGKSPAIICDDFDLREAALRILYIKYINAGQTCIAPDYLFVPEHKEELFTNLAKQIVSTRYADINHDSYTSIIDSRSYHRLRDTLDDATTRGARAVKLVNGEFNDDLRKFPPHIVQDVKDDMSIMQDEIFGPLLPVKTYRDLDEVVNYVNSKDRPLALYLFSNDSIIQKKVIFNTISGGVTLNHCAFHALQHDMPFGGIGASGMGHYHGYEGFMEFSKMRPVFYYPKIAKPDFFYPPYKKFHNTLFSLLNKLKL
jgi:coniferyl-aldehyde dehydrogenase